MTLSSKKYPTAISLFTGSGGLDLGFDSAGFDVRVAVEIDPAACATLRRNRRSFRKRLIQRPLEDVTSEELLRVARLKVGEAAVVFGGPPCQSWCVAGNRRGFDDPRGRSLFEFCRVVRDTQPQTFCIENVPGLLRYGGPNALNLIADEVNRGLGIRYELSAAVLNAAEYGVPQYRRRLFIIGWRGTGEFYFPSPTHVVEGAPVRSWKQPMPTVGDAFRGLPRPDAPSALAHRIAATIPARNKRWYGKN